MAIYFTQCAGAEEQWPDQESTARHRLRADQESAARHITDCGSLSGQTVCVQVSRSTRDSGNTVS